MKIPKRLPSTNERIFREEMVARNRGRRRRLTQDKRRRSPYAPRKGRKSVNQTLYAEYLQSEHWRAFKSLYRVSEYPQACINCGDPEYELHHKTYERLGAELFTDVVPLCRGHHKAAHKREKQGVSLLVAHLENAPMAEQVDAPA